jgi:hypothetical protein
MVARRRHEHMLIYTISPFLRMFYPLDTPPISLNIAGDISHKLPLLLKKLRAAAGI